MIARDFSFGPLVKIPSSPDGATAGNGASSRPDARRHRKFGVQTLKETEMKPEEAKAKVDLGEKKNEFTGILNLTLY